MKFEWLPDLSGERSRGRDPREQPELAALAAAALADHADDLPRADLPAHRAQRALLPEAEAHVAQGRDLSVKIRYRTLLQFFKPNDQTLEGSFSAVSASIFASK